MAHILIGGSGYGAGVQDDQVRGRALGRGLEALGGKQRFERGAIRLGRAAAEILNKELFHSPFDYKIAGDATTL